MPINVSGSLCLNTSEVITVERTAIGSYVNGLYEPGSTTTFNTLASVQQPTPSQLQILPEGERSKNPRLFISKRSIRTTDDSTGLIADVVIYKNERFKIIQLGDWDSYGHTHAYGIKEQSQ